MSGSRRWVWVCVLAGALSLPVAGAAGAVGAGRDPGRAGETIGPDFRVSGKSGTGGETSAAVAANATAGGFLVVWMDGRDPDQGLRVFGRRVAADGSVVGRDFAISGHAPADHTFGVPRGVDVAYSPSADAYLVVWNDLRRYDTRGVDLYGRMVSGDGVPLGRAFRISGPGATYPVHESEPAVAYNPNTDEFLVVWQDGRGKENVYGRRVSADGAVVGPEIAVGVATDHYETMPAVAYASTTNEFLVVFEDDRNYSSRLWDIYGQRVSAQGALVGSGFRISQYAGLSREVEPSVAFDPSTNQFLVVWTDGRNWTPRYWDIYGRWVWAPSGTPLASDFRISDDGEEGAGFGTAVGWSPVTERLLVVWRDARENLTRASDIYGRRVAPGGAPLGGAFRISGLAAVEMEGDPDLAWDEATDGFLMVRSDYRDEAERGSDIYGRLVTG